MTTWQHRKVLNDIQLEATTDSHSYGFKQAMKLTLKLSNSGIDRFELGGNFIKRSVYILIMEKEGTGTYVMSLKFLFGQANTLVINSGESISTTIELKHSELSDKTVTEHYEFPAKTRTLQVFLPLSAETPDAFENMLGTNVDEVTVVDSWTSDADLRFPLFVYWFIKFLRWIFQA